MPGDLPIWFLGDAVGYYPDAAEVLEQLETLRASGRLQVWLKGNHDLAAHSPGAARMGFSGVALLAVELTRQQLTRAELGLLDQLVEHPVELCAMVAITL